MGTLLAMPYRLSKLLPVVLVFVTIVAACGDGAEDQSEPITLRFGDPFPADHPLRLQVLEPWAEDVRAATDGAVIVEFYTEQTLSSAAETYANVVAGGQDIGWAVQGYSPGRFPATDVIEMPFVFDSAWEAVEVLWALFDEFAALRDEYSGVKVLGLWTTSPGDLWLAKGTASSVADIEGLTLRSPGPVQAAVISSLGATPVNMAAPELRSAVETGVIDGLLTVDTALAPHKLLDVIESGTECSCYVVASFLVMNLDTWNSLSSDQQAAIDELSGKKLSHAAGEFYDRTSLVAAEENTEAGIVKIVLDDVQLDEWREATRSVIDDWVAANDSTFNASDMYRRMLELAAK